MRNVLLTCSVPVTEKCVGLAVPLVPSTEFSIACLFSFKWGSFILALRVDTIVYIGSLKKFYDSFNRVVWLFSFFFFRVKLKMEQKNWQTGPSQPKIARTKHHTDEKLQWILEYVLSICSARFIFIRSP